MIFDIQEDAKELTREEFLKYVDDQEMCPWFYDLNEISDCPGGNSTVCGRCWNQAIKNVRFKGE